MEKREPLDRVSIFPAAISGEECAALIALSESLGFSPAPIEGRYDGPSGFRAREGRNNSRAAVDDPPLAATLWRRISRYVPANINGRAPAGLNERLRFYRYEPGESFGSHTDGYYKRANGEQSLLTLMIYLNEDYAGGETFFTKPEQVITPRTGMVLLFAHHLWHGGRPVKAGRKYVLRSDVMFG